MKKILSTTAILCFAVAARAQENFDPLKDRQLYFDILNICAVLAVISDFFLSVTDDQKSLQLSY